MKPSIKEIKSIAPASGWWAGFKGPDGERYFNRLAVFAAITFKTDPEMQEGKHEIEDVVGMDAMDLANFSYSTENENFHGYFHDSDFVIPGEELTKAAEERFEMGGY